MKSVCRAFALLVLVIAAKQAHGQHFIYVEPGNAACPALSSPAATEPKTVQSGAAVSGTISVGCGFDKGSYTVTLSSTDTGARFLPKTFLVNFGSIAGGGAFTVAFATVGVQTVSVAITSNMGSPAVPGRFVSLTNELNVVGP
ncbi:MAG: hypothetical protein RL341_1067 [Pseudomonadota bacterium]|jgi:hypothetical protein